MRAIARHRSGDPHPRLSGRGQRRGRAQRLADDRSGAPALHHRRRRQDRDGCRGLVAAIGRGRRRSVGWYCVIPGSSIARRLSQGMSSTTGSWLHGLPRWRRPPKRPRSRDLFLRLERGGQMLRWTRPSCRPCIAAPQYPPAKSGAPLHQESCAPWKGRRIERGAVVLEGGEVENRRGALCRLHRHALGRRPTRPVFEDGRITIQTVRAALFCLSAASIAHVEARFDDDALKNRLCPPLALPNSCEDWLPMTLGELRVQKQWAEDPALRQWVSEHRLTGSNLRSKRTDGPLDPESKSTGSACRWPSPAP